MRQDDKMTDDQKKDQKETADLMRDPVPYEETETAKPVFVYYPETVGPTDLHPGGVVAGYSCESPTPAIARTFHPDAQIVGYVDGSPYNKAKATKDINAAGIDPVADAALATSGAPVSDPVTITGSPDDIVVTEPVGASVAAPPVKPS